MGEFDDLNLSGQEERQLSDELNENIVRSRLISPWDVQQEQREESLRRRLQQQQKQRSLEKLVLPGQNQGGTLSLGRAAAYDHLRRQGCGAIVGRTGCGDTVVGFSTGPSVRRFQTTVGAWEGKEHHPDSSFTIGLCTRHGPGPDGNITTERLTADAAPEVMQRQAHEWALWLKSFGRTAQVGDS